MKVLFGSDPELLVVNSRGTKVNVQQALALIQHDPVGWDHSGRVLEIRPAPAESATKLTDNAAKLMSVVGGILDNAVGSYKLIACTNFSQGGRNEALGCHFHISIGETRPQVWWESMVQLHGAYVGIPCLLLHAGMHDVINRVGAGYGRLEDYRRTHWGINLDQPRDNANPTGIEYRSVGGLVVSSKELYGAVSGLFVAVSMAYLSGVEFPKKIPDTRLIVRDRNKVLSLFKRYDCCDFLAEICTNGEWGVIEPIISKGGFDFECVDILPMWGVKRSKKKRVATPLEIPEPEVLEDHPVPDDGIAFDPFANEGNEPLRGRIGRP